MGTKDAYQHSYLDDPVRFADQVNGALFGGRQVVKAKELQEADPGLVYNGREGGRRKSYSAAADKACLWQGKLLHIITLENQSYVDYRMVLRNMLSESIGYHKLMTKNAEAYGSIDSDTREMIEMMANVKIPEKYGHTVDENGRKERRYNMCKAFEDYRQEGVEEGIEKGRIEGLIEAITELLEDLGQIPQQITELLQEQTDTVTLKRWHKLAARAGSIAEFEHGLEL